MPMPPDGHMRKAVRCKLLGPCASVYTAANTGSWRLAYPAVDFAACKKCGICARYCPCDVIRLDREASACVQIDWDYCKGCGICANECPQRCIAMRKECERDGACENA